MYRKQKRPWVYEEQSEKKTDVRESFVGGRVSYRSRWSSVCCVGDLQVGSANILLQKGKDAKLKQRKERT